jgi:hypothetical protein
MRNSALIRKFLVVAALALAPMASFAGVFISVGFAPPILPVYAQPICPGDGYLWNPGYWAYGPEGYYWVPGVWVEPPMVGVLWTPPYWGFEGGVYAFHAGYWGPHVGFYGGVNYGFGYGGVGFFGGRWDGGHFAYNTAVMHVGPGFHNVYVDRTVIVNHTNYSHASFNGPGGVTAHASPEEMRAEHENHIAPTGAQQSHMQAAHANPQNFAKANGGHPQMAAVSRPGSTAGAIPARGAVARPGAEAGAHPGYNAGARPEAGARPGAATMNRPAAANRPAPSSYNRPAPAAQYHPAPVSRPQAESRPAPQARPESRPAPQARPAPQSHPAPAHEEHR